MKTSSLIAKIIILFGYTGLFLLATYMGKAVTYLQVVYFAIGIFFGLALLDVDEFYLYKFYEPDRPRLATRSVLFLLSLFPLGLYILTSTGSPIGVGMLLGIVSGLSLEIFALRNNTKKFYDRFLYQLKRTISVNEHRLITIFFIAGTILYATMVIFFGR